MWRGGAARHGTLSMGAAKTAIRARLGMLLAATALGSAAIGAGAPQVVGINAAVVNNVRIRSAGQQQAHIAIVKQRVALADEVQTGGRSQLQLLLLDKSTFTVGANARLTIDRFVYDLNRGARQLTASLTTGAFRFLSGRPDRAGSTSINTPIATIGVRGTIVEGVIGREAALIADGEPGIGRHVNSDPETATLILLRGPGLHTQGKVLPGAITVSAGGRSVEIGSPMRAVFVPAPGAAPIGPFILSADGLRAIQALLFPGLAQQYGLPVPGDDGRTNTGFTPTNNDRPPPPRLFRPGFPDGFGPGGQRGTPGGAYIPNLPSSAAAPSRAPQPEARDAAAPSGRSLKAAAPAPTPTPSPSPRQTPTPSPTPTSGPAGKP